jgi:hypothetical protein
MSADRRDTRPDQSAKDASIDPKEVDKPEYAVSVPRPQLPKTQPQVTVAVEEAPKPTKVAVFVAHGMGQPIPFQTLDAVAKLLRDFDAKGGSKSATLPVSRAVKVDDQLLQRIELKLKHDTVETHIYEAYWAPLTEGRINVRQVIGFLAGAGKNGLKNGQGTFKRWLFDKYSPFPIPIRTVLFLLVALAAVGALVVMNSAIALVAAGRALLATPPNWLTDNLFIDLTTTFNIVVTSMVIFGALLAVAHASRRSGLPVLRWTLGRLSLVSFIVTMFVVILAGVLILLIFFGHVRALLAPDPFWYHLVKQELVIRFNNGFDFVAWWIAAAAVVFFALWWAGKIVWGTAKDSTNVSARWLTLSSTTTFLLLVLAVFGLTLRFGHIFKQGGGTGIGSSTQHALAWPLIIAASAYIRLVLVQFVGDVAIYVMPYKLDAFNSLRKEIKDLVYKIARAVYSLENEYAKVIVVGHSLGSVIVYDALNKLILDDEASTKKLGIVRRTPLLVMFGSPLDKTAYIFSVQGNGTTEARESVAAAVQPMIQSYRFRPRKWVNLYSPWDIISGSLDFYDPRILKDENGVDIPPANRSQRIKNKCDPDATTLLIAHTEYWANDALATEIYNELFV